MFKQRKARGSLKQKRVESESEEEGDEGADLSLLHKIKTSQKTSKKKAGPAISFLNGNDQEEDVGDVAEFKVKKSKLSKSFKRKLNQGISFPEPSEEKEATVTADSSSSGNDYLSSLRAEQNFFTPQVQQQSSENLDGRELTGEEAEAMEESSEKNVNEDETNSSGQLPDYLPLNSHLTSNDKISGKQVGLKSENSDKHSVQPDMHEEPNMTFDVEGNEWEDQLAKRAGIQIPKVGSAPSNNLPQRSSHVESQSSVSSTASTEKLLNLLSYDTVKKTLGSQIATLTDRTEMADSRLRGLESNLKNHRDEVDTLKEITAKSVSQVEFLQHLRLFASDVCGMLREKEILIGQLQDAVLGHLKLKSNQRFKLWKARQDHILECLLHRGDVITLGGYLPAGYTEVPRELMTFFPSLNDECAEACFAESTLQSTMHTFHYAADTMMKDVRSELSTLNSVLSYFQNFRRNHFLKYKDAYIGLSLAQVLEQYILLDIIPLYLLDSSEDNKFQISNRPWFRSLYDFTIENTENFKDDKPHPNTKIEVDKTGNHTTGDDDNTLLPRVVSNVVLPWFIKVVEVSLDPLCATQMTTCRQVLDQFRIFDINKSQIAPLLQAILGVSVKWIGNICVPVIKMRGEGDRIIHSDIPLHVTPQYFVRQQLSRLALILENLRLFSGVIAAAALVKVAWTTLITQGKTSMVKLLSGVDTMRPDMPTIDEEENYRSVARFCKAVADILPQPNLSPEIADIYSNLAMPVDCVTRLLSLILKPSSGEETSNLASIQEFSFRRATLLKLLRQLPE